MIGIDQPHAVGFPLPAQAIIDPQGNIKIFRFHQKIKTLGIEISLYGVSPAFIGNFQKLTENMGLGIPPEPREFLPDSVPKTGHSRGVGQLFPVKLFHPLLQLLPLLCFLLKLHIEPRDFLLGFPESLFLPVNNMPQTF